MNVREIIVNALEEVIFNKAYINIVLDKTLNANKNLKNEDKGFITMTMHGIIQNYLYLDYRVKSLNAKKLNKKAYLILILAIYQFEFMDKIPAYAIINESNILAKTYLDGYAAKFINALLRNYFDNFKEINEEDFDSINDYLEVKYSIKKFVIMLWEKQYGQEVKNKLLENSLLIPPLTFRVNQNKLDINSLINPSSKFKKGSLASSSLIYLGNNRKDYINLVNEGFLSIQDEAGQKIAPLLELNENDLVLDMCAAPGSKTSHIGEILNNKGKIVAVDLYKHRVELIKNSLNRLGINNVELKDYDSTKLHEIYGEESFNKILLDAPCSGLGVIKRKADIKMNVTPESIDEITKLQKDLLSEAYLLLKKGGILVYSTCTINKKENDKQIEAFLKEHSDIKLLEKETIFPFTHNSDGFFYAKMQKGDN